MFPQNKIKQEVMYDTICPKNNKQGDEKKSQFAFSLTYLPNCNGMVAIALTNGSLKGIQLQP